MPANLTNHTIAIAIIPFLAVLLLGLLFAFWIFMLMDALRRDFGDGSARIAWLLVIIFLQLLGALI